MTSARVRDAGDLHFLSHVLSNYVWLVVVMIMAIASPSDAINAEPWIQSRNGDLEDFAGDLISPGTFDYEPYMEEVNAPLLETDLENMLDLIDRDVAKQYDFDPTHLLTMMIDRAAAQKTAPAKFWEEIQDLMALLNRSKTEENFQSPPVSSTMEPNQNSDSSADDSTWVTTDDTKVSEDVSDMYREEMTKTTTPSAVTANSEENWETALTRLRIKFNVDSECYGPDSITPFRLALMFPHYLNLGQKPFANTTYIRVEKNGRFFYSTTPDYYYRSHRRRATTASYENGDQTVVQVPSYFGHHEFGGLIPRFGSLDETARNYIIAIHLYSLYRDEDEEEASVPFRTKCAMVKWRMDKSLVSDDRRIRFLQNNDVLTEDGQLRSEISKLFNDLVPSDFYSKIFWKVFKQQVN